MSRQTDPGHNGFPRTPGASAIPTRRLASIAAGAAAALVFLAWLALTWDAWLTNFQVRWMCDEDRPFVLLRRGDVESLALPEDVVRRDTRALQVFGEAFPLVASAESADGKRAAYALVEKWPNPVRAYWGYGVLKTELSIVDRNGRRTLGTTSLYRRVPRDAPLRALREKIAPPPEACLPSDRIEFVRRVLRPPA